MLHCVLHLGSVGPVKNFDKFEITSKFFFLEIFFHSDIDEPEVAAEYCGYKGSNTISDGSNTQTITDGNTLTFTAGTNMQVAVSATDTVTITNTAPDPVALAIALG